MSSEMRELVKRWRERANSLYLERDNESDTKAHGIDDCADDLSALLARTEAGDEKVSGCEDCAHNGRYLCDTHGPQDASGDAAPVLFGRGSGGDWYVDADTKSICVDVDFDPARQLSLILKQDGRVAWSIFVQEPDSSTTKATGPSVMNTGFYEALSYIAMQAKEAK
jgi:hypothetical protein